jgi:hypothetical protein
VKLLPRRGKMLVTRGEAPGMKQLSEQPH